MERKENSTVNNTKTEEKLYVIFKRCGKASGILHLPHIDQRLQYASFTEGDGLKLEAGDIVITPKQNQLLIVHTSTCDPTSLFDIEKSSFEVNFVQATKNDTLEFLDKVKIPQRIIAGNKCYVINKRKFTYADIKDAVRVLNCDDSISDKISVDEEDGSVYMPTYFCSLIGLLKSDLFDELIEN